jgi:hypothetical protein
MKQIGRRLVNNLKFANNVNRSYDSQYVQNGAKVGYTVNARLPQRYTVNKGQALNIQNVIDNIVPITLTDQANVGIEFSMSSLTMEMDNYKEKCIAPAVDALVNVLDFDGLNRMYKKTFYTVGTPGVVPGSTGTLPQAANNVYLGAGVKLSNAAVPANGRVAMLNPNMHAFLASANLTLFNPAAQISEQYKSGMFGREALGIDEWFMDQNVATHVVGPLGGVPIIQSNGQTGPAIATSGWTAAIGLRLREGDVIQIAGVFSINPMSYQSTGVLMDFVVTADVSSDAGGLAQIPISPSLIPTGVAPNVNPLATCSASPAAGAAITTFGHASSFANVVTPQGLVYHPDAYACVMADLELPGGVWVAERISNKQLGIAIRFVKDYNVMTDQSPARVDILYGWAAVRPEMACRVAS